MDGVSPSCLEKKKSFANLSGFKNQINTEASKAAKRLEKATAAGAFAAAEIAELFLRGGAAFNCGCLQLQLPLTAAAFSCNWCLVFPISPLEIAPALFHKLQTGSRQNKNELQQLLLQK